MGGDEFSIGEAADEPRCVKEEEAGLRDRKAPRYKFAFEPSPPKALDAGE